MPVALLSSLWPILHSLRSGGHDLSILSCFIKKEIRVHPGPGGAEQSWCVGGPVDEPIRGQTGGQTI